MEDQTRAYLDHFAKTVADVRTCTVESRNDDDTYMCRTIDSQALIRAAKANPTDEYKIGSRVNVEFPSASRNTIGAMPVIVSRAPREQRGISENPPHSERTTNAPPPTIIS